MKNKVVLIVIISILAFFSANAQNVAINNDGSPPDGSAMLDITSSDKGILIPRMADHTTIASPVQGLLVYNTSNNSFWFYDGTVWNQIAAGGGSGTLDEAYDYGGAGAGRTITADAGAVEINTSAANNVGLLTRNTGSGGAIGALVTNTSNPYSAIEASSVSTTGSFASPVSSILGIYDGTGDWSAGIIGQNTNTTSGIDAHGVIGIAQGNTSAGIYGSNTNGYGMQGYALYGVFGIANNTSGSGVVGQIDGTLGATQAGHLGVYKGGYEYAVYADNDILYEGIVFGQTGSNYAYFDATTGSGAVSDGFSKGFGTFKIDHPLDPENKYLYHSFVESPDMMNIYNGIVEFDENGFAEVEMPEYFDALNKDFRYQLTSIGEHMPLYIAEEISGNAFTIGGGVPGKKVSWQVTGIRQDRLAEANRIIPEVEKEPYNKGRYIHPTLFGADKSKRIHIRNPEEKETKNTNSSRLKHSSGVGQQNAKSSLK